MEHREVEVAIIGTGTAGMAAYRKARAHTGSLALIEGGAYGTTCARVGCMPSKLLIAAANRAQDLREAPEFGIHAAGGLQIAGPEVMDRVRRLRDDFVSSVLETLESDFDPVHKIRGHAQFLDDHRIQIGDHTEIRAERIVIAAGSRPRMPKMLSGIGDRVITNEDLFDLEDLPGSVAVFGAGVIGLELGQALHRLGVRIRLFGKGGTLGPISDPDILEEAAYSLTEEFYIDPDAEIREIVQEDDHIRITFLDAEGREITENYDYLLAATGRQPNTDRLNLADTSVLCEEDGQPLFDPLTMQTSAGHIFLAGDVNSSLPVLHEAADEGKIAGENAGLYPEIRAHRRRTELSIVFCEPQVAQAGTNYQSLLDSEIPFATGEVDFADQGRARVLGQNKGKLRVYGDYEDGTMSGAEMIGPGAEHIGHLLAWAIEGRFTVSALLERMPFYHPVLEEGLRTALRDLNRNLRMGPPPVPQCRDCGPGS